MDHVTGPPEAVSVRVPPSSGPSTIVLGVTFSVPGAGGGAAVVLLVEGAGELGEGLCGGEGLWLVGAGDDGAGDDGAGADGAGADVPPVAGEVPPAEGEGDTRAAPLAVPVGCVELPGPPGRVPGAVPPAGAPAVPGADDPWLSALSRPWWVPSAPVTARMVSAAATATTAAAAAPCACRVRHLGFGGSSGLGKPSGPAMTAPCTTLARRASASGVLLLASRSTCARSPGGITAMGNGARPSSSAGASSRRFRSVHAGHCSMCRLMRLRIRTFNCPSQSSSSALSAAHSSRPERATSSAPREISSWVRARESSACAWLRETPSTAAISTTSSSCRNCSSIRSCSLALRPRTAERSSVRNSARSAPPVTSTDSSLISGTRSSAEVAALALSRSRRWHSLRATAYSHGRSRLRSRSPANLDAAMTKVSCTASAASAGSRSRERQ